MTLSRDQALREDGRKDIGKVPERLWWLAAIILLAFCIISSLTTVGKGTIMCYASFLELMLNVVSLWWSYDGACQWRVFTIKLQNAREL